jgi:uncharacterized metal-binding protein
MENGGKMNDKKLSCIDCGTCNCNNHKSMYPEFCLTTNIDEDVLAEAMELYKEDENLMVTRASAEVESEGYLKRTRVEEVMEFARKIGAKKLGIATCVGLIRESRALASILRNNGFEVYAAACKVGSVPKSEVGIDEKSELVGRYMCNPILQAKLLNEEGTDLNLVVGLCVGHDSLFYKYSDALVTTVVTKDRVTGHNPVAVLYNAESYYKRLNNK